MLVQDSQCKRKVRGIANHENRIPTILFLIESDCYLTAAKVLFCILSIHYNWNY